MIKNTLIQCAQLLDRNDIIDVLNTSNGIKDIQDKQIQYDISKLLNCYNFITSLIFENYIDLIRVDTVVSCVDKKIYYNSLLFKPLKIISVKSSKKEEFFQVFSGYILVNSANCRYEIEYKYELDYVNDFNDNFLCPISNSILSKGIISQYLATKGKYDESEYWNNKFLFDLFKIKTKKGRWLKPHFKI